MKIHAVKRYFVLLEQFSTNEADYREMLHPGIEQTEYPNQLTDHVTVSNFEMLMKRLPSGRKLLKEQHFDVQRVYETEDAVITEVVWTAVVAADAGPFKAGQPLKAYFSMTFDFRDGKIYRQRNYDCYERF
jgi:Ketosteroid isomerase-related protein